MQLQRKTRAALALAIAAVIFPASLAAAEPKNEPPFTRPAALFSALTAQPAVRKATRQTAGEPKNETPFTKPFSRDPGLAVALGEARLGITTPNRQSRVKAHIARAARSMASPAHHFSWADAAIGMLATAGIAVSGIGGYLLLRTSGARSGPPAIQTES